MRSKVNPKESGLCETHHGRKYLSMQFPSGRKADIKKAYITYYKPVTSIWLYLPSFISPSAGWNSLIRTFSLVCCFMHQHARFI